VQQTRYLEDIEWVRTEITRRGLPIASAETTPIWFVRVGTPARVAEMIMRLMKEGYYLNAAVFPAVPLGDGGIRFAHTLHHTRDQITGLLDAISHHLPEVVSDLEIVVDLRDPADVEANGPGPSDR
jgi:7-keto-8-aminopelargonate synthetase-like enzyme